MCVGPVGSLVTETANSPACILLVVAHPDDVDFGCAGTIAGWTSSGIEVVYCLATDGEAGGADRAVPRAEMAARRREEQRKAAAVLGVTDVEFLGYPDGRLTVTHELRRDITRAIRRTRPDRVVVQSPVRDLRSLYASHPDHTAAGEAAMCAVYPDARNPFAHPELLEEEGLEPHTVPEVWVSSSNDRADLYVDITDHFDRKLAALAAHASQTAHLTGLEDRLREWAAVQARAAGFAEGRLAEGYLVLDTR